VGELDLGVDEPGGGEAAEVLAARQSAGDAPEVRAALGAIGWWQPIPGPTMVSVIGADPTASRAPAPPWAHRAGARPWSWDAVRDPEQRLKQPDADVHRVGLIEDLPAEPRVRRDPYSCFR
jgi:hypothetical protein